MTGLEEWSDRIWSLLVGSIYLAPVGLLALVPVWWIKRRRRRARARETYLAELDRLRGL